MQNLFGYFDCLGVDDHLISVTDGRGQADRMAFSNSSPARDTDAR